jgi:hypothetical protein
MGVVPSLSRLEKKLAFDAVIGVLGVFLPTRLGGGVISPSSASEEGSLRAATFVIVGVLSGRRLSGGKRRG